MATAAEIASAGTYLSKDFGVEVTDGTQVRASLGVIASSIDDSGAVIPAGYGLKVIASDGATVIIDGQSDMFRIAASGTLNTPDHTGPGVFSSEVNVATGLTYVPTVLCWIERTNGTDMMIPYLVWDQTTQLMIDHWEEQASVVNTNQTKVYIQLRTARTGFQAGFPVRYYIQQQVSI